LKVSAWAPSKSGFNSKWIWPASLRGIGFDISSRLIQISTVPRQNLFALHCLLQRRHAGWSRILCKWGLEWLSLLSCLECRWNFCQGLEQRFGVLGSWLIWRWIMECHVGMLDGSGRIDKDIYLKQIAHWYWYYCAPNEIRSDLSGVQDSMIERSSTPSGLSCSCFVLEPPWESIGWLTNGSAVVETVGFFNIVGSNTCPI
jgi:hypothetical protein